MGNAQKNVINKIINALELITADLKRFEFSPANNKPKTKKSLMTIDEIADFMGVCKGVAYKYVRNGKLPKAKEKIGKSSYWDKKEVKQAIKELRKNERRTKK